MVWTRRIALCTLISAAVLAGCAGEPKKQPPSERTPAAAAPAPKAADREFVLAAADANMAEVALAKMAQRKAQSSKVKRYAKHMADDHAKANQQLMDIARAENMSVPTQPSAESQRTADELGRLSKRDFDRAYLQTQITDHERNIELFKSEAQSGKNERLAAYARQTLPALEEHLEKAHAMMDRMGTAKKKSRTKKK